MSLPSPAMDDVVDVRALDAWMREQGLGDGPIERLRLLSGGTQNLLLGFERDGQRLVLRRPPLHPRPESNETMRREARILRSLAATDVPHPRLVAACGDETILGSAFFLMKEIQGDNPANGLRAGKQEPQVQHAMGIAMVEALTALGRVDYRAVGLDGFGKPDHYLERQVDRWARQLKDYASFPDWPGPTAIPHLDRVQAWLEANRPGMSEPGIIHGDFQITNVLFAPCGGAVAAVIDWELATIGDPLVDLGWLLATWPAHDAPMAPIYAIEPWIGFPSADELVAAYARGSSRDVSNITWYMVLACYKLGIILEGTYARSCAGKADRNLGNRMHRATTALLERAEASIAGQDARSIT